MASIARRIPFWTRFAVNLEDDRSRLVSNGDGVVIVVPDRTVPIPVEDVEYVGPTLTVERSVQDFYGLGFSSSAMDDAALQEQLRRIKHRQYLILLLLGVPYLYLVAEYMGFALAGVVYAVIGILSFGAFVVYRRRNRNVVGQ